MSYEVITSVRSFSLVLAAIVAVVAMAPSGAMARSRHKAVHAPAPQPFVTYRGSRLYGPGPGGAFAAMPGGASYPGYGYGYGDNSHGCSACN